VPVFSVFSPVPSSCDASDFSIAPSISRSNRPGSSVGDSAFLTSSLPVSRTLVTTQTMSLPSVTFTSSGPGLSAGEDATTCPVPLEPRHSIDLS
jgi:hypothetical protein